MNNKRDNKHIFALFYPNLSKNNSIQTSSLCCNEKVIVHRINTILRLEKGDRCILFDGNCVLEVELRSISKNSVEMKIEKNMPVNSPTPSIVLGCALLKKESFETACYHAAQMGVQEIVPVLSEKVQRKWGGEKEQERLKKIMIAACEQSKQFFIPELKEPQSLKNWLKEKETMAIPSLFLYLDAEGSPISSVIHSVETKKIPSIALLVGPEGDFTSQEKQEIIKHEFSSVALTHSIVRSQEAVLLALGIVRSFFRK